MGIADSAQWYTRWCEPIVWALYMKDETAIREAINTAHAALAEDELDLQERCCLRYQLAYLEFQAQPYLDPDDWKTTDKTKPYIEELSVKCGDPTGEGLRIRLYIQLRMKLDRHGLITLEPDEMNELLDALPTEENTIELWLYIANWAFRREQTHILSRAYELSVMNSKGFQHNWFWYRIDLMWKLVRGNLTTEQIRWVIKQAEIPHHLSSLNIDILPKARELGLVTDDLEHYFNARTRELTEKEPERIANLLADHTRNEEILGRTRHLEEGAQPGQ